MQMMVGGIRNIAGVIIAVGMLSGCGKPVSFADQCAANGFTPGSQVFLNCINSRYQAAVSLNQQWYQNAEATRQANYEAGMRAFTQPVYRPQINCLSSVNGNFGFTTCN